MGFVLWYRLTVSAPGPVPVPLARVSNDVMGGGQHLLDATIEISILQGAQAAAFRVAIIDLPAPLVEALKTAHSEGANTDHPMMVKAQVGYFDNIPLVSPPGDILVGAVTSLQSSVQGDTLVTELRGFDLAAWQLLRLCNVSYSPGGSVTPAMCVAHVLDAAGGVSQQGTVLGSPITDYALRAPNGLAALGRVADWAGQRFAVRDNALHWDTPGVVPPGPTLDPETNLVNLDDGQDARDLGGVRCRAENSPREVEPRGLLYATVLGDPAFRPGQSLTVRGSTPPRRLYVEGVTHRFSTSSGYVCELELADQASATTAPPRRAHGVAHRLRDITARRIEERTPIDVGTISYYEPGKDGRHLVTLNYGQDPKAGTVAASVESPVLTGTQLHHKPIASPFAWHKCGLVVPAYEGQRALLAHTRGDPNDAAVAGYLWSEDPAMDRPQNEPGDWWLCLPTQLSGGQPSGPAANDLTDAAGLRVVQAKGLRIDVGENKLADIGERPEVPNATTFRIEHAEGTTVTISDDGALEILTNTKKVTIGNGTSSIELDGSKLTATNGTSSLTLEGAQLEMTNGSVSLKLSGSAVEVS
jgi:hypothetical protein